MGDSVSEQAKIKACELANALVGGRNWGMTDGAVLALARQIQAFSDAAKAARDHGVTEEAWDVLGPFILPEPVDPLLTEAREIVRASYPEMDPAYTGRRVTVALTALRRGIELAKEAPHAS